MGFTEQQKNVDVQGSLISPDTKEDQTMRLKLMTLLMIGFIASCAVLTSISLEKKYGTPKPQPRQTASITPQQVDYWHDIKPIFDGRCIVCHACYDAPCQLKLTAPEGVDRGATKDRSINRSDL